MMEAANEAARDAVNVLPDVAVTWLAPLRRAYRYTAGPNLLDAGE